MRRQTRTVQIHQVSFDQPHSWFSGAGDDEAHLQGQERAADDDAEQEPPRDQEADLRVDAVADEGVEGACGRQCR
jgi:hypothetical protein